MSGRDPLPVNDRDPLRPSFAQALGVWFKIGCLGFGGPAGQIALMHRILVDEKRWIDERRFLNALNFCMLLPGPEATQLATYVGWRLHRWAGGLAAGILFVLPGALVILALSAIYARFQQVPAIAALFYGIKPAVAAIVVEALLRIGKRALKDGFALAIAAAAFAAIFALDLPFPLVVLGAGLLGALHGGQAHRAPPPDGNDAPRPSLARSLGTALLWLAIWLLPVAAILAWLGPGDVFGQIALFFSKMAVVTFGGAYAVLAYVAQQAVGHYGWLGPGEMLDGLGLAETTPGPLILVLQFVGFVAAYRAPGALDPLLAGTLGAGLTLWVTFAPCFLWIFLGAPYIEAIARIEALARALAAITAAVTGVIFNLMLWFALHVLFGTVEEVRWGPLRAWSPQWNTLDPVALLLALAALLALLRFRLGLLPTLGGAALLGALWQFAV
ncbi:MAG: chromate efflux transporter [Pseudomonadota bacterium]